MVKRTEGAKAQRGTAIVVCLAFMVFNIPSYNRAYNEKLALAQLEAPVAAPSSPSSPTTTTVVSSTQQQPKQDAGSGLAWEQLAYSPSNKLCKLVKLATVLGVMETDMKREGFAAEVISDVLAGAAHRVEGFVEKACQPVS